ncbi:MAG: hypothetical protein ACRENE_06235 [Polyangiaceae bacterium]
MTNWSETRLVPGAEPRHPPSESRLHPSSESKLFAASESRLHPASEPRLQPTSESKILPPSDSKVLSARPRPTRSMGRVVEPVHISAGVAPPEPAVVEIRSRCHDEVVEYTHAFASAYARSRFRSAVVQPISVASYELLSNAVNYGSAVGEIVFQFIEAPQSVGVRVSNDAVQVRIDMLRAHLERIGRDPEGAFLEEMRRSMGGGAGRAMLGLARIVHECKLTLDVHIDGSHVTIAAREA